MVKRKASSKKRRSKAGKGANFERDIARQLSWWWTNDKRDDIFWRTHGSGARATSRYKRGHDTAGQHGDLCATDPVGKPLTDMFTIELKRGYSRQTLYDALDQKISGGNRIRPTEIVQWILKAKKSAKKAGSFSWMVLLRRDRMETIAILDYNFLCVLQSLGTFMEDCTPYAIFKIKPLGKKKPIQVFCTPLDVLLKVLEPNDIRYYAKYLKENK